MSFAPTDASTWPNSARERAQGSASACTHNSSSRTAGNSAKTWPARTGLVRIGAVAGASPAATERTRSSGLDEAVSTFLRILHWLYAGDGAGSGERCTVVLSQVPPLRRTRDLGYPGALCLVDISRFRFVVSHPFCRDKSKGWGTEEIWRIGLILIRLSLPAG